MARRPLTAVVIGAGWAGEGHTIALQQCGVEVVGICSRTEDVVRAVAERLGVSHPSTDWRASLTTLKPDIVSIATPANLRIEVVELAASLGSHILCDKPLAAHADEAERMTHIVEEAGVKHGFAATQRYDPSVAWAAELIAGGAIGKLRAVDFTWSDAWWTDLTPWSWVDVLTQGGGALNNAHTHILATLERMVGARVQAAAGGARTLRSRAPVLPDAHDFRITTSATVTPEEAAKLEWRECDADISYAALHRFSTDPSADDRVDAFVRLDVGASQPARSNGWRFYGASGNLVGDGVFTITISRETGSDLEPLPTPQRLLDALPQVGDDTQSKWVAFTRDFVADIQGEPHDPYLTFRDGWRYQAALDAIRQGAGWVRMPA
jgi:predicted dehydrogenase